MAAEKGRSLAETPTWSVATVTTLMVAACFLVERSLSRIAKVLTRPIFSPSLLLCLAADPAGLFVVRSAPQWLRKTKRKAMLAALEKIREGMHVPSLAVSLLRPSSPALSPVPEANLNALLC